MNILKISKTTLWMFLSCALIVIITQFFLLKPLIDFSIFSEDDWKWLLLFKSLPDPDIFSKFATIWINIGIHGGGYAIYMGVLGELFGNNYVAYQYFNISLKIIATLTIFPLILVIFKNKLLSYLTTIIFAISSASTGSLYWYMKGGVFLGVIFMNLFFISYYYILTKSSAKFASWNKSLLFCSSVLIFLAYLVSPTRIYPAFLIVIFVEIFFFLKNKSKVTLIWSIARIICFLVPSILVALQAPVSPHGNLHQVPFILLNQFIHGNLYNFLSPFAAMGYSLMTNGAWKYFGVIDNSTFTNFANYLVLLFKGSILIFSFVLLFLSYLLSKKPIRFFILVFSLNFILDILIYFIVNSYLSLSPQYFTKLDPSLFNITKYPTYVAMFIMSVASVTFLEWYKEKTSKLLLSVFIGPLFALIFIIPMWLSLGYLLDGYSSTQYYYQIPAMGMSVFAASILVLFYQRFKKKFLRIAAIIFIILFLFKFYQASKIEIDRDFLPIYPERIRVSDQQILHDHFIANLGKPDQEGNLLVYIELPEEFFLNKYYKRSLLLNSNSFGSMVNWHKFPNTAKCLGNINSVDSLKSSYVVENGRQGFVFDGRCSSDLATAFEIQDILGDEKNIFYSIDSLYAYRIEQGRIIDIKNDLLKEFKYPPAF